MFGIDFTFLWTAVNLAIIYWFVNKFLFKKLGVFMQNRSDSIAADIQQGESLKAEGDEYRRQHEAILAEAAETRRTILEEAKLKASREYESIINEAKKDAGRILEEARAEGLRDRERIQKELRRDVATLVISTASKVIEANMDNEKNRELVDRFLSTEGAA